MKTITFKTFFLGLLFLITTSTNTSAQGWEVVGNAGITTYSALTSTLALDNDNVPYVFFLDQAQELKGTLLKFTDNSWQDVGEPGFTSVMNGGIQNKTISLEIDNNNIPYVAYLGHFSENFPLIVMKFENNEWEIVEQFSLGNLFELSLGFDSNNTLYLSYTSSGQHKMNVIKLENGVWETVGVPDFSLGQARDISLIFDSNDTPYVAFRDGANNNKATVMKFENGNWQTVGTAGFSDGNAEYVSLALNSNNIPYVAYRDYENNSKITVQRFVENSWEIIGSEFSENGAIEVSLAFNSDDVLFVAYRNTPPINYKAVMQKYENNSWQPVGPATGFSQHMTVTLCFRIATDKSLYVSFSDYWEGSRVTVMKYDYMANIDEITQSNISMYPNPTNDIVYLANLPYNATVKIIDSTGKVIYNNKTESEEFAINTTSFSSGLYWVQITGEDKNTVKKLIVK